MPWDLSVCRLDNTPPPMQGDFWNLTRTPQEISLVCENKYAPQDAKVEQGWIAFEVQGPIPFNVVGVLAGISTALAAQKISIFAVSTFDTDYILCKAEHRRQAEFALREAGYTL